MRKNAIHFLTVCLQEATKMRSSYFNGEVFSAEEGPRCCCPPRWVYGLGSGSPLVTDFFNREAIEARPTAQGLGSPKLSRVVTFFHDIDSFFVLIHSDEKKQDRIRDSGGFSG